MDQRIEITKYVAGQLGLAVDDKSIHKLKQVFWCNFRSKSSGGLKLTDKGFESLIQAGLKSYQVKFEEPMQYTNQLIIHLDKFIDCPWFVTNKEIYVFNDKMAVQLVLFSGNIARFSNAKAKSLKSA
jgi:hypothetical protein